MPVQELQNQTGALGGILGLVGGFLAANPARKQRQLENERASAADKRAAQELANNTQAATDQHQAAVDTQATLAAKQLAHDQEAKVIGAEPAYDTANPNAWMGWAMKASHYYAKSDPEYSRSLAEQVRYGANPVAQEARATHDVAGAGLDKARAKFTNDYKWRAQNAQNAAMKLAQAKGMTAEQIAGIRAQATMADARIRALSAQAVAGTNVAGRQNVAQMNDAERLAATQLVGAYMLQGKSMDEATRLAVSDWTQANANYRAQVQAETRPNATTPDVLPTPPVQAPPSGNTSIDFKPSFTFIMDPKTGQPVMVKNSSVSASSNVKNGPPADMKPGTVEWFKALSPAAKTQALANPKIPADVKAYLKTLPGNSLSPASHAPAPKPTPRNASSLSLPFAVGL